MSCGEKYTGVFHKHHIIPKHRGGGDDDTNLVSVTPTQHTMFHWCNWKLTGLGSEWSSYWILLHHFTMSGGTQCSIHYYTNIYGEIWCGRVTKKPWFHTDIPQTYWCEGVKYRSRRSHPKTKLKPYTNRQGLTGWFRRNPDREVWYSGYKFLYPRERKGWKPKKSKVSPPPSEFPTTSLLHPEYGL